MSKIKSRIFCLFTIFLSLAIFSASLFGVQNAYALSSTARSAIVVEASSGRVLFAQNENAKLAMASTTKIMTAITAIENCENLDEKFEISPKAVGVPGTSLYLRKGDVYSVRELLYALMLISGNDASVAIAERVAGSVSEFVTKMNELAKKIGATKSHFANTHGLDADGHYTTAFDLAKITAYALENPIFHEIVSTKHIKIENGNGETRFLKNKNKLLSTLDGCVGVKTGFTDDAGRCLVSAVEKNGLRLVCVVLNCGPMFEESATLLTECSENYKIYDLTKFYDFGKVVGVNNGRNSTALIGTHESFLFPLTDGEVARLRFVYDYPKTVDAPLAKNTEIGNVQIFLDDDLLFTEKIFLEQEVKPKSFVQRLKDFFGGWTKSEESTKN